MYIQAIITNTSIAHQPPSPTPTYHRHSVHIPGLCLGETAGFLWPDTPKLGKAKMFPKSVGVCHQKSIDMHTNLPELKPG